MVERLLERVGSQITKKFRLLLPGTRLLLLFTRPHCASVCVESARVAGWVELNLEKVEERERGSRCYQKAGVWDCACCLQQHETHQPTAHSLGLAPPVEKQPVRFRSSHRKLLASPHKTRTTPSSTQSHQTRAVVHCNAASREPRRGGARRSARRVNAHALCCSAATDLLL